LARIDEIEVAERYKMEGEDNTIPLPETESTIRVDSPSPRKFISWEDGDSENPYNWSTVRIKEVLRRYDTKLLTRTQRKKVSIVIIGMIVVVNSTLGSALPSNAIPYISKEFGITSKTARILPVSMYLVGYVFGPLLFGPLSETYGRKIVMISTFILFTLFTLACALAPNLAALSVFRLFAGIYASSPLSVAWGVYADIYADPVSRGRALSIIIGVREYFFPSFEIF
jgi:Na+/melibiose symporter-like transporter